MKKILNFIFLGCVNTFLCLYSFTVYGSRLPRGPLHNDIFLGFYALMLLLCIISALSLSIMTLRQKFKRFDYKSEYQQFKPNDKIKITFINENKKVITKKCRISSIDSRKIVFANSKCSYECGPSDIKRINKRNTFFLVLKSIFFLSLFLVLIMWTLHRLCVYNYTLLIEEGMFF